MTAAEFERIRPRWRAWVYGAARNPIHKQTETGEQGP
jgi:hypothetical protein